MATATTPEIERHVTAIRTNTDAYLRDELTRDDWHRRQIALWDAVPREITAAVCAILVPFGGAR